MWNRGQRSRAGIEPAVNRSRTPIQENAVSRRAARPPPARTRPRGGRASATMKFAQAASGARSAVGRARAAPRRPDPAARAGSGARRRPSVHTTGGTSRQRRARPSGQRDGSTWSATASTLHTQRGDDIAHEGQRGQARVVERQVLGVVVDPVEGDEDAPARGEQAGCPYEPKGHGTRGVSRFTDGRGRRSALWQRRIGGSVRGIHVPGAYALARARMFDPAATQPAAPRGPRCPAVSSSCRGSCG